MASSVLPAKRKRVAITADLRGYWVSCALANDSVINGVVYAVDEVASLVMVLGADSKTNSATAELVCVPFHGIRSWKQMTWTRDEAIITRIDDWIRKSDSRAKENNVDSKNLKRRRKELVSYLRENQIPVTDAGDWVGSQPPISLLSGQVVIHPPYTSRSILSDNQIVAKRVRGILGRFYSESISQPKARATGILPVDVLSTDKVATPGEDGYVVFD